MSGPIPGKSSWPELLGANTALAAQAVAHDRPDVVVEVLMNGVPSVKPDYNPLRVIVYFDYESVLVAEVPVIG